MPEVINDTWNIGAHDLPDMYALSSQASDIHIRKISHVHVTTIKHTAGTKEN